MIWISIIFLAVALLILSAEYLRQKTLNEFAKETQKLRKHFRADVDFQNKMLVNYIDKFFLYEDSLLKVVKTNQELIEANKKLIEKLK